MAKDEYKCVEPGCTVPRAVAGYDRPQDLGRHMFFTHGVEGKVAQAKARAEARRALAHRGPGRPRGRPPTAHGTSKKTRGLISAAQRKRWARVRQDNNNGATHHRRVKHEEAISSPGAILEGTIAHTFGRVQQLIATTSESTSIPYGFLADRVAELVHLSTGGKRVGAQHQVPFLPGAAA